MTWRALGLPNTPPNTATSSLAASRSAFSSAIKGNSASPLSVTISGRFRPSSCSRGPASLRAPAPKWIVVGKAKRVMLMVY
jgi:hypothetical protein